MCGNIPARFLEICILLSLTAYILVSVHVWKSSRILSKPIIPSKHDKPKIPSKQCSEYFCSSSECIGNKSLEDSSKWIVLVDPDYSPTRLEELLSLRGWHVVIVGDEGEHVDRKVFDVKKIHLINVQQQQFGFAPQILSNSGIRRNVGNLYAIKNGAKFIYNVAEDVEISGEELSLFDFEDSVSGLLYRAKSDLPTREKVFNPYTFFYNPGAVPGDMGGYGVELLIQKNRNNVSTGLYLCRKIDTAAVQESLMSRKASASLRSKATTEFTDDSSKITLPLGVAPGTFSLWIPRSTLFRYDAFFALVIPILAKSRRGEILRSLFIQKLLHLVGRGIMFHCSEVLLRRTNKNEFNTEDAKLFFEVAAFVDSWKCPHALIFECMLALGDEFRSRHYWDEQSTSIIRIWIDNLKSLKYEFPAISIDEFDCQLTFDESSRNQNCRRANIHLPYFLRTNVREEITRMRTRALEDLTSWCVQANYSVRVDGADLFADLNDHYSATASRTTADLSEVNCRGQHSHKEGLPPPHTDNSVRPSHLNKVLVIINNHPRKKGIGMLQRLYQPYFGITIFCGSYNPIEYRDEGEFPEIMYPFNYIHISQGELLHGYFFHYCVTKVKELRLRNVEGYFFTADDAIFHFWNTLDLSEVLFPVWVIEHRIPSIWWPSEYGARAAQRAAHLFAVKYKHNKKVNEVLACYQEGLIANGHKDEAISHIVNDNGRTLSDFFYIPEKRIDYLAEAIEIFFEAELFVELTMNKLLQTVPHNRLPHRYFEYIPQHSRHRWTEFYGPEKVMVHPIKINEYADVKKRKDFCENVVYVFRQALLKCIP